MKQQIPKDLLQHFENTESSLCNSIDETGMLPDNIRERIIDVSRDFIKETYLK